jgi:transposase
MPKTRYVIDLTPEERGMLEQLLRRGHSGTRKLTRARILLKADEGLTDAEIAAARDVGIATGGRTRQRFVEAHLAALEERPRPGGERKLTGKQEAHLLAVACTPAPAGQRHWTLRLLAAKVGELGFVESMARETVRQILNKMSSSRGSTSSGVCPR